MSNTVDNRVVSMTFDNQQFEDGIKQTITSLDNLKEALQFNTQMTGLNTLQSQFNSFSLANIEDAVESLSSRFSALGVVGASVLVNMTNKAIGLASKLESITLGQITSGGKARAQKVADARFKLNGLLDDAEDVEKAFNAASKAVDGTAYGLDAAVSTASQLVASNVQLGEEMDTALRGVAGLAAMTNSSFEEMGAIFTRVAGNGRLMGMQLTQISAHGVNAAATLAKYLNTTEAEVRSMVSKGEIDFQTFANAMNDAFGDQAAKANETLSGALSNVKSALSRIGEIFYSGIIENKEFIETVNQLRLAINRIKKAMEPLKEPFATLVSSFAKLGSSLLKFFGYGTEFKSLVDIIATGMNTLAGWLDAVTARVDSWRKTLGLDEVVASAKTADKVLRSLTERERNAAKAIWERGSFGVGAVREAALEATGLDYQNVQDLVNLVVAHNGDMEAAVEAYKQTVKETTKETTEQAKEANKEAENTSTALAPTLVALQHITELVNIAKQGFASIKKVIGAVSKAFKKVFSWKDLSKDFNNFVHILTSVGTALEVTDERADKLTGIFSGLFSIIDLMRQAFVLLATAGATILSPVLSVLIDAFLWIGDKVGRAITKFNEFTKEGNYLNKVLVKIRTIVAKVSDLFKTFFSRFNELPSVIKIKDALKDLADIIGDKVLIMLDKAGDAISDFLGIADGADTDTLDTILEGINTALENMINFATDSKRDLTQLIDKVKEFFAPYAEAEDTFKNLNLNMKKVQNTVKSLLTADGLAEVFSTLETNIGGFSDKIGDVVEKIIDKLSKLDYAKGTLIAFAASIIALLSSCTYAVFHFGEVAKSVTKVGNSIASTFKAINNRIYDPMNGKAKLVKAFALAILAFAAAVFLFSKIPADRLWDCVYAVAALIGVLGTFTIAITIVTKNLSDTAKAEFGIALKQISNIMLSLAASVMILALAMYVLSTVDYVTVWKNFAVISALLIEIAAIATVISKITPKLSSGGFAFVLLAASVFILAKALETLSKIDIEGIDEKLQLIEGTLLVLGTVALMASGMKMGSAVGVLSIVASIFLIEIALIDIMAYGVTMDEIKQNLTKFVPVLITLALIGAYMVVLSKAAGNAKGVASVILATVAAIYVVTVSIGKLSEIYKKDSIGFGVGIAAIIVIMYMLMVLIHQLKTNFVGTDVLGKALFRIVAAIGLMALICYLLGSVDPKTVATGVLALTFLTMFAMGLMECSKFTEKADYKSITAIIGVLATLALIIALLSLIKDKTQLLEAVGIFGMMLIAFGVSMYLACNQADKVNSKKLLAMLLLVAMLSVSLLAIMKYSSIYQNGIEAAGVLGLALLAVATSLAIMNKTWPSGMTKNRLAAIALMIGMVAVIGAAIMGIAKLGGNWKKIATAAAGIALCLTTVAIALMVINNTWPASLTENRLAELAIMVGMVAVIGASLMGISALGKDWRSIAAAAGGMSAVLMAVGGAMTIINSTWPKSMTANRLAALAIMIGMVAVIGVSLMAISALGQNWANIVFSAISMGIAMMAVAGAMAIMQTVSITPITAASFLIAATSLIPIAGAMAILSQFDWGKMMDALGVMASAIAVLVGALVILAAFNMALPGVTLLATMTLVPVIYAMAAAMGVFAAVVPVVVKGLESLTKIKYEKIQVKVLFELILAVAALGAASYVFAVGLLYLSIASIAATAALVVMLKPITVIAAEILALVMATTSLVQALTVLGDKGNKIAIGLKSLAVTVATSFGLIAVGLVSGIVSAINYMAKQTPQLVVSISVLSTAILAVIVALVNQIITIVVEGIYTLTKELANKAPKIVDNIMKILVAILDGIYSYVSTFAKYGIMIIYALTIGIMTGIELMAPSFIEEVVSLALTLIEALIQTLYNNQDRLANALGGLFSVIALTIMKLLNEMSGGLLEEMGWYTQAENDLKQKIEKMAKENGQNAADIQSESYTDEMNKNKGSITDTSKEVMGDAIDETDYYAQKKVNILSGNTLETFTGSLKKGVGSVANSFTDLINGGVNGVDLSSVEHIAGETVEKATTYDSGRTRHIIEQNVSTLCDRQIESLKKEGWKFSDTAEDIMYKEYWTGVAGSDVDDKTQDAVNSNVTGLFNNSEILSSVSDGSTNVMSTFGSGLANYDLQGQYGDVVNGKVTDFIDTNLTGAAMEAEDAHSPSREAMKVVEYFMLGLVAGVKDNMGMVNEAFSNVGSEFSEATKSSLYAFSDLLGDDKEWTPTITPVVDTTNIENARTLMNETFDDTSFKMAANANVTVGESSQSNLANQISNLSDKVDKLANKEYVNNFVVNADTTVDGTTLRKTSAAYTIKTVDDNQRAYIMSRGGRA